MGLSRLVSVTNFFIVKFNHIVSGVGFSGSSRRLGFLDFVDSIFFSLTYFRRALQAFKTCRYCYYYFVNLFFQLLLPLR